MPEYRVVWDIDIVADTPEEAARKAQEIQRDPNSIATTFCIVPIRNARSIREYIPDYVMVDVSEE